jgi:uncharacterized HhH-GPD family protein
MTVSTRPASLPFTGDPEADALLATDPMALLLGFLLDQQVTVQKAFSGPLELRRRIGTLEPRQIAATDPEKLSTAFRTPPALHRFPGSMAEKARGLAGFITERYGGDPTRIWTEAADGKDLERRLLELPGIGEMKARTLIGILCGRFGVRPPGWETVMPTWPTLADVDSAESLAAYQAGKRAKKAELRAQGKRV